MTKFITPKNVRIARTCNLYLSFFALGLCVAIPGPTLLDLQHIISTDMQHIAYIYMARSMGYLFGTVFGGVGFDMVKRKQTLLIACNLLMALSTLLTPWCRSLVTLIIAMAVCGFSMGALDTGANVFCLNLWGKDSGPFYQALHFTFGLGGLVAPVIAAPFLSLHATEDSGFLNGTNVTSPSDNASELWNNGTFDIDSTIPSVTYAYSIIGCYCLLVTILFIVSYILAPSEKFANTKDERASVEPGRCFTAIVVGSTGLLIAVYVGTEIAFAQMLTTYAVKGNLKLSKSTGSYMTSAYWGSFTVFRGVSIFIAIKMSNFSMMTWDLAVSLLAAIVLLTLGTVYEWALWLGSVLLGMGIASFFPATIAWIERYITITNKIAALMVLGAAAGEMALPLTISILIDDVPEVLFYVVLTSISLCCLITLAMYLFLRKKNCKYVDDEKPTRDVVQIESISRQINDTQISKEHDNL